MEKINILLKIVLYYGGFVPLSVTLCSEKSGPEHFGRTIGVLMYTLGYIHKNDIYIYKLK